MEYKFYKEETGRWYVDLPEWPGEKEALEMVMGADVMLDIFAQGENNIKILLSETDKQLPYNLRYIRETPEYGEGALYEIELIGKHFEVWLCDVTKFVFNKFPLDIYLCITN